MLLQCLSDHYSSLSLLPILCQVLILIFLVKILPCIYWTKFLWIYIYTSSAVSSFIGWAVMVYPNLKDLLDKACQFTKPMTCKAVMHLAFSGTSNSPAQRTLGFTWGNWWGPSAGAQRRAQSHPLKLNTITALLLLLNFTGTNLNTKQNNSTLQHFNTKCCSGEHGQNNFWWCWKMIIQTATYSLSRTDSAFSQLTDCCWSHTMNLFLDIFKRWKTDRAKQNQAPVKYIGEARWQ